MRLNEALNRWRSCRQTLNASVLFVFFSRDVIVVLWRIYRLQLKSGRSIDYKSISVHPLLGVWILNGTVCVVFKKCYFTLSLPFKQRLVFRLCCDVQNVVSIILSTQYRFFLRFFLFLTSCHKCLVYDDRANTRLRAPVVRRFVPKELPYHTRHDALLIAFQSSLKAIDCFWKTQWRNAYLTYWVRSGKKATITVSVSTLLSFIFLYYFPSISVVPCCYELRVVSWRSYVTWPSFLRQASKYENTVSSGNHERVDLALVLGLGSTEGCCILMLKCFYTCS